MEPVRAPEGRASRPQAGIAARPPGHTGVIDRSRDGPLPALFLALTAVAGAVDAISYLRLDHTFVANMTGNIIFLGFALAGAQGVSLWSSVLALAAFVGGAAFGGALGARYGAHRGHLFVAAVCSQLACVGTALAIVVWSPVELDVVREGTVIALLAFTMGTQSAATRRIALSDLPTIVLTLTVSALASESLGSGDKRQRIARRVGTVLAMLTGAIVSAALTIHVGILAALAATFVLLLGTAVAALRMSHASAAWIQPA